METEYGEKHMNEANEGPFKVPEKDRREERKIYYLKLSDRFFKDKTIKLLRKRAGGDTYTVILLKLFLQSLEDENHLYYDGIVPTFEEELALSIDEKPEDIKVVLDFLATYGWLIEESKDSYYLPKSAEMSGSITQRGLRKQRQRERERGLIEEQSSAEVPHEFRLGSAQVPQGSASVPKYIDRDIDIDRTIDRDRCKEEEGSSYSDLIRYTDLPRLYPEAFTNAGVILPDPTVDEVRAYQEKNRITELDADTFYSHMRKLGWKIDGCFITNWQVLYVMMESEARDGKGFIFPDAGEAGNEGNKEEEKEDGISDEE